VRVHFVKLRAKRDAIRMPAEFCSILWWTFKLNAIDVIDNIPDT
jgi:hypothetical protein